MKTKDKIAGEYADKKWDEGVHCIVEVFLAGWSAAEKWTPIDDELPKENETVLVSLCKMDENGRFVRLFRTGRRFCKAWNIDGNSDGCVPVKWRLIDRP